jgi:hypothetical protein
MEDVGKLLTYAYKEQNRELLLQFSAYFGLDSERILGLYLTPSRYMPIVLPVRKLPCESLSKETSAQVKAPSCKN